MTRPGVRKETLQRAVVTALFLAILALALFVRLRRIGDEGLHGDELTILRGLHAPAFLDALRASRDLDPPMTPVCFLVQYAWARAVGTSVAGMHLLSALFSAATLVAVFLLGRKLGNSLTGLAAMLLLAVSPIHVYYSLEIRNYPLTALLGCLSMLTLLHAVGRPSRRMWTLNFAVDLLLALSHLFANLLFVPQALFLLACHRRRAVLAPWGLLHAVIAALVAAWLRTCDLAAVRQASAYIPPLSRSAGLDLLHGLAGASYAWDNSARIGCDGPVGDAVVALFMVAFCVCVFRCFRGSQENGAARGVVLVVLTVAVPPLLLGALSLGYSNCFLARYALSSAVAVPLLLACAVTMPPGGRIRTVLSVGLVLTGAMQLTQIVQTRPQRTYRWPLIETLDREKAPGGMLFILPPYSGRHTTEVEVLAAELPIPCARRASWSRTEADELAALHERGVQAWVVNEADACGEWVFEVSLEVRGLAFRKWIFPDRRLVLYCLPVTPGRTAVPMVPPVAAVRDDGDLEVLLRRVAAMDPERALAAWVGLLDDPRYRAAAAWGIDALLVRCGDIAGLVAQWEAIVVRDGCDATPLVHLGEAYRIAGELGRAADAFARGLQLEPTRGDCLLGLSSVRMAQGRVEEAMELAQTALAGHPERAPKAADICLPLLRAETHPGAYPHAEAVLRALLQRMPDDAPLLASLGRLLSARGEMAEGIALFAKAVQVRPVMAGAIAEACASAARVRIGAGDAPAGVTLLQRAVTFAPSSLDIRTALGGALEQTGDLSGALAEWRGVLEKAPEHTMAADRAESLLTRVGDRAARVAFWCGLVDSRPDAVVPRGRLAAALEAAGDMAGAATTCLAVQRRDGGNETARACLDRLLAAAGDGGGVSERTVTTAATDAFLKPEVAERYAARAAACLSAGDAAGAAAAYGWARALVPGSAFYAAALGDALARANDPAGAEAACRAALRIDPGQVQAGLRLAELLAGRGEAAEAESLLQAAAAAAPGTAGAAAEACAAAAARRMAAGDPAGAAAWLRRALTFSETNLAHRAALGAALEAAGDMKGALNAYRRVLDRAPDSPMTAGRIDVLLDMAGGAAARVAEWKRIAAAHPDAAVPQLHLGLALEAAGKRFGSVKNMAEQDR